MFLSLLSTNFCTKEERHAIALALDDADFRSPYGRELSKILRHGVGGPIRIVMPIGLCTSEGH